MSGFDRKVERNKLRTQIKKDRMKRDQPLSKYRFKTQKELQEEYAAKLTEQMIQTAKESENKRVNNE